MKYETISCSLASVCKKPSEGESVGGGGEIQGRTSQHGSVGAEALGGGSRLVRGARGLVDEDALFDQILTGVSAQLERRREDGRRRPFTNVHIFWICSPR